MIHFHVIEAKWSDLFLHAFALMGVPAHRSTNQWTTHPNFMEMFLEEATLIWSGSFARIKGRYHQLLQGFFAQEISAWSSSLGAFVTGSIECGHLVLQNVRILENIACRNPHSPTMDCLLASADVIDVRMLYMCYVSPQSNLRQRNRVRFVQ